MTTTPRLVKPFTQVNTTDAAVGFGGTPFQGEGQLTGLPDGGYVVVWTDFSRTLIFGSEIVGQRYDSLGNKVGGEVVITRFPTGDHSWPAVTTLSNGDIAVAYLHNNNNVFDNNVYVDIYSSALVFVRTDIIDESGSQTADPSITALAGGGYAISYTQVTGTPVSGLNFDVVARVVSPTGTVGARLVSVRKHFESFESFVIQSGDLIREGHHRCGRRRTADVTATFGRRSSTMPALASPPTFWSTRQRRDSRTRPVSWSSPMAASL